MARDRGRGVVAEDAALRLPELRHRQAIERDERCEIDHRRNQHETGEDMIPPEIGPEVRAIPVGVAGVFEPGAPAPHQAEYRDDDD